MIYADGCNVYLRHQLGASPSSPGRAYLGHKCNGPACSWGPAQVLRAWVPAAALRRAPSVRAAAARRRGRRAARLAQHVARADVGRARGRRAHRRARPAARRAARVLRAARVPAAPRVLPRLEIHLTDSMVGANYDQFGATYAQRMAFASLHVAGTAGVADEMQVRPMVVLHRADARQRRAGASLDAARSRCTTRPSAPRRARSRPPSATCTSRAA